MPSGQRDTELAAAAAAAVVARHMSQDPLSLQPSHPDPDPDFQRTAMLHSAAVQQARAAMHAHSSH